MKKLAILVLITTSIAAQSQTVEEAIQTTLGQFNPGDRTAMMSAVNRFDLIAKKWSTDWITHYYAGYAKTIAGATESDKTRKAQLLDEAEKSLEASKVNGAAENDEVYTLLAMIASNRIGLSPDAWQKHMETYHANLRKAKQLRKDNPRTYYVEGMSKFYTPEAYGGGKENALIYFEKAEEYFKSESTNNIRKPYWGREHNTEMIKECKQ